MANHKKKVKRKTAMQIMDKSAASRFSAGLRKSTGTSAIQSAVKKIKKLFRGK